MHPEGNPPVASSDGLSVPIKLAPLRTTSEKSDKDVDDSWKLVLGLAITFLFLFGITSHAFAKVPPSLPIDAPEGLFSEGRAMHTTSYLADTIGHRQVSTTGEELAAQYLFNEAKRIAAHAASHRPDLEITVAREKVHGAHGRQVVFGLEIANAYNGLSNIILRVAPIAQPGETLNTTQSVLVNAHYDSTLGTVGASDAASCVGVALEIARTIVYNASLPLKAPIVFLFNGGEETLMQASHGFMATSPFAKELGAFINLESTGPWGPDVVFQHSGDWTLRAYSRVAPAPKGTTVGQDFFDLGLIPGDTDYRMFSYRHYGAVPGIDVAFLFDGTAYHTARDETARIRPGTLQGMGENMLATALEFARVLAEGDYRGEEVDTSPEAGKGGHVFFDILAKYMVVYSHRTAVIIHQIPLLLMLSLSLRAAIAKLKGQLVAAQLVPAPGPLLFQAGITLLSILGAVALPALIGLLKALITSHPLAWYSNHVVAYNTFIPAAAAGVLVPHAFFQRPSNSKTVQARRAVLGFALLFSGVATALTEVGMHSAYIFVAWAVGAIAAALLSRHGQLIDEDGTDKFTGLNIVSICACVALPITISLPTAMSIAGHIMEKIGLAGSAEGALGRAVPDAAIGALTGLALVLALGFVVPYVAAVLGQRGCKVAVAVLLATSIVAGAVPEIVGAAQRSFKTRTIGNGDGVSSGYILTSPHPYSHRSPKRVIFQHFNRHTTTGTVYDSFFSFSTMDAIPVEVALPEAVRALPEKPYSDSDWVALYPLNYLVTGTARAAPFPPPGTPTPTLRVIHPVALARPVGRKSASLWSRIKSWFGGSGGAEASSTLDSASGLNNTSGAPVVGVHRWHLELDTVRSAWAVLNITGEVNAWSLGPEVATTVVRHGNTSTTCHIVRYASGVHTHRWKFWLETPTTADLRIELFVKHLEPSKPAQEVVDAMADWVSATAVTTWSSVWEFTY